MKGFPELNELDWLKLMVGLLDAAKQVSDSMADATPDEAMKAGFHGIAGGYAAAQTFIEERLDVVKSSSD